MHQTMRRKQCGDMIYYTCSRMQAVRHAFTTKFGGVSTGECESLNLGFNRGDIRENVLQNYKRLTDTLHMPLERLTMTCQVHGDAVSVVTQEQIGMGLQQPMSWQSDAIITNLPNVPLIGYYADCVVALLFDPVSQTIGVCHAGWRGTAAGILGKTVDKMVQTLDTKRDSLLAVLSPSIGVCCFETDADVPTAMEAQMGAWVQPMISARGNKFFIDLQRINLQQLKNAGVLAENMVDSGICTRCEHETFWSHRATNGHRGVQGAVICL